MERKRMRKRERSCPQKNRCTLVGKGQCDKHPRCRYEQNCTYLKTMSCSFYHPPIHFKNHSNGNSVDIDTRLRNYHHDRSSSASSASSRRHHKRRNRSRSRHRHKRRRRRSSSTEPDRDHHRNHSNNHHDDPIIIKDEPIKAIPPINDMKPWQEWEDRELMDFMKKYPHDFNAQKRLQEMLDTLNRADDELKNRLNYLSNLEKNIKQSKHQNKVNQDLAKSPIIKFIKKLRKDDHTSNTNNNHNVIQNGHDEKVDIDDNETLNTLSNIQHDEQINCTDNVNTKIFELPNEHNNNHNRNEKEENDIDDDSDGGNNLLIIPKKPKNDRFESKIMKEKRGQKRKHSEMIDENEKSNYNNTDNKRLKMDENNQIGMEFSNDIDVNNLLVTLKEEYEKHDKLVSDIRIPDNTKLDDQKNYQDYIKLLENNIQIMESLNRNLYNHLHKNAIAAERNINKKPKSRGHIRKMRPTL